MILCARPVFKTRAVVVGAEVTMKKPFRNYGQTCCPT